MFGYRKEFFQIETYAQIGSHIPSFSNSVLVIVSVSVVAFSSFGESNDTAGNWFTWSCACCRWMYGCCWEHCSMSCVFIFVEGNSAADNAVRATEHNNRVSALKVCSEIVHNAAFDMLKITDTSQYDIPVGLARWASEGVVDFTDGTIQLASF